MSQALNSMVDTSQGDTANTGFVIEQSAFFSNKDQDSPTTKRSEVLRHVFPRSSRRSSLHNEGDNTRVSKTDRYRGVFVNRRQLRPRETFHRVISSFFGSTAGRGVHSVSSQVRSRTPSFGSRPDSSVYGSVPSLDLVSPGAFLFSGPSFRSAGSYNNSTSRLPSLKEPFSDACLPRRIRSHSFSMVDYGSIEDELLEPVVSQGVVRSMSDVLHNIDTPMEDAGHNLLKDVDDEINLLDPTLILSSKISWPNCSLTASNLLQNLSIIARVLHHTDTTMSLNLRSTCRSLYSVVSAVAPLIRPASGRIPTEILLGIYNHLNAKNFNAARRTCRTWMMASLNKRLLTAMLARGGYSGSQSNFRDVTYNSSIPAGSEEWRLSRHLSRQCSLASRWTGNGLDIRNAIVEHTNVDLVELAHGYTLHKGRASGGLIFMSSICGKYLLVARDTLIYIYGLEGGLLQPLTSVVCPRRILAMSMNTAVGRDAVAVLLEGRMGMVCELRYGRPIPGPDLGDKCVEGDGSPPRTQPEPRTPIGDTSDLQDAIDSAEYTSSRVLRSFPYVQNPDLDSFHSIELKAHNQGFSLRGTDDTNSHDRNLIAQTWNLNLRGPLRNLRRNSKTALHVRDIPIESGTSTFYRHLCSEDDPPRNVSICPQRRCVAFGCSAGIELHWIDALTGQSLSRWFPLTSPSDHLYFLSPRPGFESAKKLRLISSAAHPNDRLAISKNLFNNPTISSFWGSFGFETRARHIQSCDHYHAIPLSDGHHVLFIDPATDQLTLGCDAPLGGPAKLLREVLFNAPKDKVVPRVYTAAADMSSGARIVAVYGDTVMLYSIPIDVLDLSRQEQAAETRAIYNVPPFSPLGRPHDHWLNWWDEPLSPANRLESGNDNDSPIWPIALSGTAIGTLPNICELAVQTQPDVLIWAFTHTSQCRTWRLHSYNDPVVRARQVVDRNGLTHMDESGDLSVQDDPRSEIAGTTTTTSSTNDLHIQGDEWDMPTIEGSLVLGGFDGNTSGLLKRLPRALAVENDSRVGEIDVGGCGDAWFEGSGDVVTWVEV